MYSAPASSRPRAAATVRETVYREDHRIASAETGDASFLIDGVYIGCGWRERNSRASNKVVHATYMRVHCSEEQFGRRLPPLCPHGSAARGGVCPPKADGPAHNYPETAALQQLGLAVMAVYCRRVLVPPLLGALCNITCIMMMITFMRAASSCSSRNARK